MSILDNKIDFAVIIAVNGANPNGDPLNGNRPRVTYDGYGEISDVCIKRKIRNRLQDEGECIYVQSEDRVDDGFKNLKDRTKSLVSLSEKRDIIEEKLCKKWIDVRAFGQVIAFKKTGGSDTASASVRGPVSIQIAKSVNPIDINSMRITKSVNNEPGDTKGPDTMGLKHSINFGLYVIRGAINVQLAEKTGFSTEDADKIKRALQTLFVNDSSAARPDGSMEVVEVIWWQHNTKIGQYSSATVQRSLEIKQKDSEAIPSSVQDYDITIHPLEGLEPEVIKGL